MPRRLIDAALREINCRVGRIAGGDRSGMAGAYGGGAGDNYWSENMDAPAVMDLLYKTPAWPLAEALIGPGQVRREEAAQVALRFPTTSPQSGLMQFHVDSLFYPNDPNPQQQRLYTFTLLAYVLLNDLPGPDRGNFTICPGSHALLAAHVRKHGIDSLRRSGAKIKLPPAVQITGKAGDLVLCHYLVVHDRAQNFSPDIRYAVFFRLRHVDNENRQEEVLANPWLELPGLKALPLKS